MYGDEEFWAEVTTCFREFVESHFKKLKAENAALEAKVARLEAALEARPGLKYVGTFREGRVFEENSFCTYDGNVWHCNQRTSVPPGNGSAAWTLAVKHGERGRDGRTAKMPMEFERVVDTTGKSIEEVLIEAAADFDALIAPNFSGEELAAERAKFHRELRDALLKHDGETLNCSGASISTEASAQMQRRRLRWLIFFCFSVVNPACRPTNLQCRPCLPKLFSFWPSPPYQFESPSSYALPFSWPAIDKRHLLSCPAPTTSNNGTIHARLPRAKKLGTQSDLRRRKKLNPAIMDLFI